MHEFEYFVMMAWVKSNGLPCAAFICEKYMMDFPDEDARRDFCQKNKADYVTIEKRYSYEELPFE